MSASAKLPSTVTPTMSTMGQHGELMAQEQVLEHEVLARAHPGQDGRDE